MRWFSRISAWRRRLSLRFRLTLWTVVVFALLQLTLGLVFLLYQRVAIDTFFDQRLALRLQDLRAQLLSALPAVNDQTLDAFAHEAFRGTVFDRSLAIIYDQHGRVLAANRRPAPALTDLGLSATPTEAVEFHDAVTVLADRNSAPEPSRVIAATLPGPGGAPYRLVIASSDAHARTMLRLVGNVLLFILPIGILAAGVTGWLVTGAALAPLRDAEQLLAKLVPETLSVPVTARADSPESLRLREQLEFARRRLEAGFAAHERFMSNISHELRTPIATLLTEAQILESSPLDDQTRTYVRSVQEELRRMSRMIDSFLTLTRLRAGQAAVRPRRCPVNDLVMDSVAACHGQARELRVGIEPTLADDPDLAVEGDLDLLRTMIDHLIRNALRFTPQHGTVRVLIARTGDLVSLTVRDDGAGIAADLMPRLFERLYRSDSTRVGRGQGLGLQIAQSVAELHGGLITAANRPGGGCDFSIRLPAARTHRPSGSSESPRSEAASLSGDTPFTAASAGPHSSTPS